MGDALLQKTYTTNFFTKKRIKNNGTVPQYYVEDDHEAIIPKELAGTGRTCPPQGSSQKPLRQETYLLLQSLLCTDCCLRRMR